MDDGTQSSKVKVKQVVLHDYEMYINHIDYLLVGFHGDPTVKEEKFMPDVTVTAEA